MIYIEGSKKKLTTLPLFPMATRRFRLLPILAADLGRFCCWLRATSCLLFMHYCYWRYTFCLYTVCCFHLHVCFKLTTHCLHSQARFFLSTTATKFSALLSLSKYAVHTPSPSSPSSSPSSSMFIISTLPFWSPFSKKSNPNTKSHVLGSHVLEVHLATPWIPLSPSPLSPQKMEKNLLEFACCTHGAVSTPSSSNTLRPATRISFGWSISPLLQLSPLSKMAFGRECSVKWVEVQGDSR